MWISYKLVPIKISFDLFIKAVSFILAILIFILPLF